MKNKVKRFMALLLAVMLVMTAAPPAAAVTTVAPEWTVTAYPGDSWVTYPVCVREAENLAAIELMIGYDPDVFTLQDYSLSGMDSATVNSDTPGAIGYNGISLDGVNGSITLMYLYFSVSAKAEAGDYPITIAVGDARDTALQPMEISADGGSIKVHSRGGTGGGSGENTVGSVYFYMWSDMYNVAAGQDVRFSVYCYDTKNFAAGNFAFTYDPELFAFKSAELEYGMNASNAICSVNSLNEGYVLVSYAGLDAAPGGHMMTLTLTAKEAPRDTYTDIRLTTSELYNTGNEPLSGNEYSCGAYVSAYVPVPEYPVFTIHAPEIARPNETFTVTASVEGESGIAAGDFCVSYDTMSLQCMGVQTAAEATGKTSPNGSMVMTNPNFDAGSVRFSLLCEDGITEDETLVYMTFKPRVEGTTMLSSFGTDVVDAQFDPVTLEYGMANIILGIPTFTVQFFDWDGTLLKTQPVPYLEGATAPEVPARAYTDLVHYTFTGWDCDFSSVMGNMSVKAQYAEAEHTLGDKVISEKPTCTESGTERRTCSGCRYSESYTVAATGHLFTTYRSEEGLLVAKCERNCGETDKKIGTPSWRVESSVLKGEEYTTGYVAIALYGEDGRLIAAKFCERAQWSTVNGMTVYRHTAPKFTAAQLAATRKMACFNLNERYIPLRDAVIVKNK